MQKEKPIRIDIIQHEAVGLRRNAPYQIVALTNAVCVGDSSHRVNDYLTELEVYQLNGVDHYTTKITSAK